MQNLSLRLGAWAVDAAHRAGDQRGQATVEYVGLTVVLGTGKMDLPAIEIMARS